MKIIGITGGTGSGKSTACGRLRELGYTVVDFDEMIRGLQKPGMPVYNGFVKEFGEGILLPDGNLDRAGFAKMIFSDPEKLRVSNEIGSLHMDMELARRLDAFAEAGREATRGIDPDYMQKKVIFLDAPTLFETRLKYTADEAWVIDVEDEVRIARIMARDGISREAVLDRMSAQMSTELKRKLADVIIDNSDTPERFIENVNNALADLDNRLDQGMEQLIYK